MLLIPAVLNAFPNRLNKCIPKQTQRNFETNGRMLYVVKKSKRQWHINSDILHKLIFKYAIDLIYDSPKWVVSCRKIVGGDHGTKQIRRSNIIARKPIIETRDNTIKSIAIEK